MKSKQIRQRQKKHYGYLLLLLPGTAAVLITLGYPMVRQVIMSFQKFGLAQQFGAPAKWVGFANYKAILTDPYFWEVFAKSVGFCAWTAAWTMVIGIGIAVLMLRVNKWVRAIMGTGLVVVWAMPALASLTVWQWMIDPNSGLVNYLLTKMGFSSFAGFNWLASSYWTFYIIASALITWASIPLVTITVHAAMAQVPEDIIEAAEIDGASSFQQLTRIVLPIISPVIALIGILQIIWDLKVFTQIYVLQQGGGIASETNLLGTYVYQVGIAKGNYGMASALAMVILLLTLLITSKYLQVLFKQGDVD